MKLSLNTNIGSLTAQNQLLKANEKLQTSFERLSSGLRINRASDDPAGLAMASGLQTDSRLMAQAVRNVNDGISLLTIAESALQELNNILGRQAELAQQAANGTYTFQQRRALQEESDALVEEFNRIINSTEFNGINPLNGETPSLTLQAGISSSDQILINLADESARIVGDGTFTTAPFVATDDAPLRVASGDINGDGILDLATAFYADDTIGILIGNGDGTFSSVTSYVTGDKPEEIQLVDINNDNNLDVVNINNLSDTVSILLGVGDGTFEAAVSFDVGGAGWQPRHLQIGDFDGDSNLDVVVNLKYATEIRVLFGNGDGTLGNGASLPCGAFSYASATGDFNNDGITDIVSGSTLEDELTIYLSNGDRTFSQGNSYPTSAGSQIYGITTGDFNHDGNVDIAATEYNNDLVRVYFGNGDGSFETSLELTATTPYRIVAVDLNGDGIDDIATNNIAGATTGIDVILSRGDGTFDAVTSFASTEAPRDIIVADFNGDGVSDLASAIATGSSGILIFLANTREVTTESYLNICTTEGAQDALTHINESLNRIAAELGNIAAAQSRLSHTVNHLQVMRENYAAASSKIVDADIAEEVAQMVRQQILQQAITAVMAQANQQPALVLELLK